MDHTVEYLLKSITVPHMVSNYVNDFCKDKNI